MIVLTWCFLLSKIFFWIWSLIHWIKIFGLFITSIFRFLLIIMFYIQTLFIGLFKFYCLLFSFTSAGLYVINLKRCQQTGENAHERLHNTIQGKKKNDSKNVARHKNLKQSQFRRHWLENILRTTQTSMLLRYLNFFL